MSSPTFNPNYVFPIQAQPDPVASPTIIENPDGQGGFVVVKEGYKVHQLEEKMEGRAEHRFWDLDSFAEYMNHRFATDGPSITGAIDILVQDQIIKAYVEPNHSQPQIIRCEMINHPAWDAWCHALAGVSLTQREMQQHVRSWRPTLQDPDSLLAAFSAIEVSDSSKMTSHIDETGATRLASKEGRTNVAIKIPPMITAEMPVYEGVSLDGVTVDTYEIEILISVDPDPLRFSLSCPTISIVKHQARRDLAQCLRNKLASGFLVGIGSGAHTKRCVAG